jgi:hypothetical protein
MNTELAQFLKMSVLFWGGGWLLGFVVGHIILWLCTIAR